MKQLKTDVVVISAGTAGLPAAVTAAECGASVMVFEKRGTIGGTGNFANGLFGVESRLQKAKLIALTREQAFRIYMDYCQWRVNARLIKTLIDRSAENIDWLERMGVEFSDIGCHNTGFYYTWHIVKMPKDRSRLGGSGATVMKILAEGARELGVEFFLKTPVKEILKEEGRVVGIMAEDESGELIRVTAGAVISATGGFHIGSIPGFPGQKGDGIRIAREAGAATIEPEIRASSGGPPRGPMGSMVVNTIFQQPNLVVNLFGERFMDEEIMNTTPFSSNIIAMQKDSTAFTIFDEDTKNLYMEKGFDFAQSPPAFITHATGFDDDMKKILEQKQGNFFMADSIEELAEKGGIDLNGLKETVKEYNQACKTGCDRMFNKNAKYLKPIRKPRFYMSKRAGFDVKAWEGIKVNHNTEVLTPDFKVIPGLYAAGMDIACNIYSGTYPWILPATAMGFAIHSGRLSGENAAGYVKSKI